MAARHRRTWALAALGAISVPAMASAGTPTLGPPPRLAAAGCSFHTVTAGDTVWAIAGQAGITLDEIAGLNPQIPRLNLIRPGDQIATSCAELAPAVMLERNEMQHTRDPRVDERAPDGRATQRAVLAALYAAGARGEQLVTLAALTEGESGRKVDSLGDVDIQDATWGPSAGVFQIRTVKAQRGTGQTRDVDRVATLDGGARSAVELWDQSVARGKPGGQPWSAWQRGWHESYIATYTAIAKTEGWL